MIDISVYIGIEDMCVVLRHSEGIYSTKPMQATSLYKYLHIHIYVYTYDIWVCLKIRENTHQLLWLFYSGKWWLISWFSGWWTIVTYPRICTPTKTVIWSMYGLICIMEMHVITHGKYVDLVGGLDHFLFSHILWIIIPFQRGWNHQPGMLSKSMRKTTHGEI